MFETINFGKHRGKLWDDVAQSDPGYIKWAVKEKLRQLPKRFLSGPPLSIPNSILVHCNDQQRQITDILFNGGNVIAPGIPGSGKSYVAKNLTGNIVALAPTGVAAMNIGGSTFHSYFNIDPNDLLLEVGPRTQQCPDKALWIMDEVFYTSASLLYKIMSHILATTKSAQFLLLGDPMQLKPVDRRDSSSRGDTEYDAEEKGMIRELKEWKGKTIFDVFDHLGIDYKVIKLTKSIRHKGNDTFDFMKAARCASLSDKQLKAIKIIDRPPLNGVTLTYTNESVDKLNREGLGQFEKLIGVAIQKECYNEKGEEITAEMIVNSETNQGHKTLLIKKLKYYSRKFAPEVTAIGARVMITKNFKSDGVFVAVNGDTGILMELEDKRAKVLLDRTKSLVYINRVFQGYTSRDGKWKIGVTLIPMRTCYAVTVHKSQGMTIACNLHIMLSDQMAKKPGLLYTAITRSEDIGKVTVSGPLTNNLFAYDKKWFAKFEAL